MKIHEYQAREIFTQYGIPAPGGAVCNTPFEAKEIADKIGKPVVIKAQVQVGGRGKAGGIKIARTPDEAEKLSKEMLSIEIKGIPVEKIMVAEYIDIKEEHYVGIVVDRASKGIVIMTSPAGGIDIEQVAKQTPKKIHKANIDPLIGLKNYQIQRLITPLFTDPELRKEAVLIIKKLYQVFIEMDCSLAEINPLVVTSEGELLACDAKINIDNNSLFREELAKLRDPKAEDPLELAAREAGLSYVGLDGNVACIVNGAGLAMTTMDMIKLHGGEPANFLDVGGSSSPQKVVDAMKIILTNKRVKSILFNIFGGITRCDDIAKGIISALNSMEVPHPIVVRLTGTNQERAQEMLKDTDLNFATSMTQGVKKAIKLAR